MAFVDPNIPNLADFITFCQGQGVLPVYLDPASPYYQWALTHAENTVYTVACIPGIEYVIAVYNYGMHWLVSNAIDVTGQAITDMVWSSGAVIVTPATPLAMAIGTAFGVFVGAVLPLFYNGAFSAMVINASQFAYTLSDNPGVVTNQGVFGFQFFANLRKQYQLLSMVAGPIQESHDENTGQTIAIPDFFKTITISDLDLMKTPWGQRYLAFAQKAGPTVVGVT